MKFHALSMMFFEFEGIALEEEMHEKIWYELRIRSERMIREAFKKKYREKSENGLLGGGVSDLFHFFKLL